MIKRGVECSWSLPAGNISVVKFLEQPRTPIRWSDCRCQISQRIKRLPSQRTGIEMAVGISFMVLESFISEDRVKIFSGQVE